MNDADGKIVIGTELDDSGFDKGVKDLEKKAAKVGDKNKTTIDVEVSSKQIKRNANNIKKEINNYFDKDKPKITPEIKDPQKEAIQIRDKIEEILGDIKTTEQYTVIDQDDIKFIDDAKEKIKKLAIEYEKITGKKINISGITDIGTETKKADISLSSILKKVTKWGLAIFSVRSTYMFIRQAVSTISQYNEQFATDLEYIRYALANTLAPVIQGIIKLVRTLLTYINYIWKAWTTHDLFASADAFADAKKSTSGMAKDVKQIKKDLASFDEMNVLQDQSDTSTSGGDIAGIPSFNLTDENIPIPWWVDWIAKNKETVITIAGVIGGLFAASTVSGWLSNIGKLFGASGGTGLVGLLGTLKNIALIGGGIIITGYVASKFVNDINELHNQIQDINAAADKYLDDRTKQIEDIDVLIDTANVRMTSGNEILKNNESIFGKITGLSKDQLETIKNVVEHSEATLDQEIKIYKQGKLTQNQKEKLLKSLRSQIEYNDDVIEYLEQQGIDTTELVKINDKYKENWALISDEVLNNIDNLSTIEELNAKTNDRIAASNDLFKISNSWLFKNSEFYKQNLEDAKKTVTENEKIADKEMEIYNNNKLTNEEKKKILTNLESQITYNQTIIDKLKEQGQDTSDIEKINDKLKTNWEKINTELSGTKTKFDEINNTKLNDKNLKINVGADTSKAKKSLSELITDFFGKQKNNILSAFDIVKNLSTGGVVLSNSVGFAKGGVSTYKPIKCARGSIISQPGRGVPISRAVGGERGAEGVIPLTNSQMMEQLGQTIGKYININLTNITKLDNRQIAKEQKIINAQNDFALNR